MARLARILMLLGTAAVVVAVAVFHASDNDYSFTGTGRFAWSLAYVALLALVAYGAGLPDVPRSIRAAIVPAFVAAAGGAMAISLVQLVAGDALLPRLVVFGAALLLAPWYVFCTAVSLRGRNLAEERDRVVVVAPVADVAALRSDLEQSAERPAVVVASLTVDEARVPAQPLDPPAGPLLDAVGALGASVVVLAREAQLDESVVAQAASLHAKGCRVRTLSLFYDEWLGKLPISELEQVSLMFDIGEVHRLRYGRLKRIMDVTLAAMGLAALGLALPLVLLGDVVANRGPILYRQVRVGKNGAEFEIVKFRTMRSGGDVPSNEWTTEDDPRITAFGRVLRRSHLDELPQVVNILRGDLSVVGPRPEQPRYVDELVTKLPFYDVRHMVRPGLTGWAQVKYGYAGSETDAVEKLQFDFYYLRHQGLALDSQIVARTVRSVLGRDGR